MMESILDSLTAEKLYPSGGTNLLDLEELSDGDFLTNVVSSLVYSITLGGLSVASRRCHLCEFTENMLINVKYPAVLELCWKSAVCILIALNQTHICLFRPEPDLRRAV